MRNTFIKAFALLSALVMLVSGICVAESDVASAGLTLAGRTCVFEGSTGAIGREAVLMMAEKGMNVVMVTHNPANADQIVAEADGLPGTVIAMSNSNPFEEILQTVEDQFGSVDVYINKTGGRNAPVSLDDMTEEDITTITTPLSKILTLIPFLERSEHARLVFTSNVGSLDGNSYENAMQEIAYGAINSMTYALTRELAEKGITINTIALSGMINDSEPGEGALDIADYVDTIPVGHAGTSREYGALILYLVSEEADFMTGNVLNFSGGLYVGP
ncbi:MAG: SDR family oxidoreductase [Clostridia bacterium]|nr:SDR family oxidoreductase [Clostridia bacterium]